MGNPGTYLDRMRENVAMALHEGASLAQLHAHLLAVVRPGRNRPGVDDYTDGAELAEHAETLNQFRTHQPGEVPYVD